VTRKPDAGMLLEIHLRELGLSFEREFRFHPPRKWRADFRIHNGGSGYVKDLEKYRIASAKGYKLFRFSTQEVLDGTAKKFIKEWA
jgi:hypothetical protein